MGHDPDELTLHQAADRLGVHYMTAYRYVRTGKLPARRAGSQWVVDAADLARLEPPAPPGRRPAGDGGGAPLSARLVPQLADRLTAGDEPAAWDLVETALGRGAGPDRIHLELLGPALARIGSGWASGSLSVADEHRASATAARLIARLGPRFTRRGRRRGGVVLAAPAGELHALPVAMVADLLRWSGFDVVELGADTPAGSVADAVAACSRPVAVGLVAVCDGALGGMRDAVTAVRATAPGLPVFVGGAAVTDEAVARSVGADHYTPDGRSVVELVEELATGRPVSTGGQPGDPATPASPGRSARR